MNKISAKYDKTKYYPDKHLTINIDDNPLDKILKNESYEGLVSTLLDWLFVGKETELIWQRIFPDKNETSIAPILMCPDCSDLFCIVIVAEIFVYDNKVEWKRIGEDHSKYDYSSLDNIGQNVNWFTDIGSFEFSIEDYRKFYETFKELLI